MNYAERISTLRNAMELKNVAGFFSAPDAGWEYLAGLPREGHGNTKQRQNSLEYTCLLVTATGVTAFSPRLSALGFSGRMQDFPVVDKLVIYDDPDLFGKTFEAELKTQGLLGKKLAVTRDVPATLALLLQERLAAQVVDMSAEIDGMRAVKDMDEIALMKEASRVADCVFNDVLPLLKPDTPIRDIEHEIERRLETYGCSYSSFPAEVLNHGPLAGNGVGASYGFLKKGYTIAFDFGMVYKGYCSDFGRTVFLQEPDKDFINYHNAVMEAQAAGMKALVAGRSTGSDVNAAARAVMNEYGYGDYFIHRLGHGIGKDVHERPFLAEGEKTVVQSGMCFTVEPSIYIPHRCLLRVEDVVLVTESGCECLNTVTKDIIVLN